MTEDDEDEMYGLRCGMGSLEAENARLRECLVHMELHECPGCKNVADLQEALEENAKLREQIKRLVTLLRVDCDIEASWDGLRKFWSIELTEGGCLMRDRACKAEAENAKLREVIDDITEVVEASDPALVQFIAKRMERAGIEVDDA